MARDIKNLDKIKGLLSDRGSSLLHQRDQRMREQYVEERRKREELQSLEENMQREAALASNAGSMHDFETRLLPRYYDRMGAVTEQISNMEKQRKIVAHKKFMQQAHTSLGDKATTHDVHAISTAGVTYGAAIDIAKDVGSMELERQIANSRKRIDVHTQRALTITATPVDSWTKQEEQNLKYQTSARNEQIVKLGIQEAALAYKKRSGTDIKSEYESAENIANKLKREQEVGSIRSDVESGRLGDRQKIEADYSTSIKNLIESFNKFDVAIKSGAEGVEDLKNEFNKAAEEHDKMSTALKASRDGGGRGGWGNIADMAGGIGGAISGMGSVGMAAGALARLEGVNIPIAKMRGQIGLTGIVNQQFEDAYGATQGDMGALRRLMTGQFSESKRFSEGVRSAEDIARGREVGGAAAGGFGNLVSGLAGGILNTAKMVAVGGLAAGTVTGLNAAGNIAGAGANDYLNYKNLDLQNQNQISQMSAQTDAFQTSRALDTEVNKIRDFQYQKAFDYQNSLTYATRGLGLGSTYDASAAVQGSNEIPQLQPDKKESIYDATEGTPFKSDNKTGGTITSRFGAPRKKGPHKGTDVAAPTGTPISAIHGGKVEASNYSETAGNMISVRGPDGELTSYFHMDSLSKFKVGDVVKNGDIIGGVGNTGSSEGSHLHIQQRDANGKLVNLDDRALMAINTTSNRREGILRTMQNPNFLNSLGVDTKTAAEIVGTGVGALGGILSPTDISRSTEVARAGYFQSPQQYLQMRGALSDMGGTQTDIEDVLERAVTRGLDNAKNIQQMVEGITSIAGKGIAQGISLVSGAGDRLGAATQALIDSGTPANMATLTARAAGEYSESMAASGNISLGNIMEMGKLRKAFPGATTLQTIAMSQLTPAEIASMEKAKKSGNMAEYERLKVKLGVGDIVDTGGGLGAIRDASSSGVMIDALGGFAGIMLGGGELSGKRYKDMTKDEQTRANALGRINRSPGVEALDAYNRGEADQSSLPKVPGGGYTSSGEGAIRAGAAAEVKVITDALINGALDFGKEMQKVVESLDITKFVEGAQGAAQGLDLKNFGPSVAKFENAVSSLTTTVNNLNLKISKTGAGNIDNNGRND